MRRVIVVGAGLFGQIIASRLTQLGITPIVATRSGRDVPPRHAPNGAAPQEWSEAISSSVGEPDLDEIVVEDRTGAHVSESLARRRIHVPAIR